MYNNSHVKINNSKELLAMFMQIQTNNKKLNQVHEYNANVMTMQYELMLYVQ